MKLILQIAAGVFLASMAMLFVANIMLASARMDAAGDYARASHEEMLRRNGNQ